MTARLIVNAATARRLGLGNRSVAIGSGVVNAAAGQTKGITVRLTRIARAKLSRARRADVTLEISVHGAGTASRRATRRLTLG
jgi:predicted aspartyl protease